MKLTLSRVAPVAQGAVYVGTGLWPIVHLRSFERVTGPKADDWLVKTVGGLLAVIGATLLLGARRRRATPALRVLGVGTAAVCTAIDVVYVARGRLSKVYLADAAFHVALAAIWSRVPAA